MYDSSRETFEVGGQQIKLTATHRELSGDGTWKDRIGWGAVESQGQNSSKNTIVSDDVWYCNSFGVGAAIILGVYDADKEAAIGFVVVKRTNGYWKYRVNGDSQWTNLPNNGKKFFKKWLPNEDSDDFVESTVQNPPNDRWSSYDMLFRFRHIL
ncbi:MAG: hypothetical protein GY927_19615 [bacterium]|nr:hypothetical protein [bacterium]